MENKIVKYDSVEVSEPLMPATPPRRDRVVVEVPAGSNAQKIQDIIDTVVKRGTARPVIHLSAGTYPMDRTLVIPDGSDLQLCGDGPATILHWTGNEDGNVLWVVAPSHATVRDLVIDGAKTADGMVVENADQAGARVLMDQVNLRSAQEAGLLVDRLRCADVSLLNVNHADSALGIKVVGTGTAGTNNSATGRTVIFCGSSSNNELSYDVANGGRLLVRDTWYESGNYPRFMR